MSDVDETTDKTFSTAIVKGSLAAFLHSLLAKTEDHKGGR